MSGIGARRSLPPMPPRLELDALLAQRKELDERLELAVAVLERQDTHHAPLNRRKCAALHDERAAVQKRIVDIQKRIDDILAAEQAG